MKKYVFEVLTAFILWTALAGCQTVPPKGTLTECSTPVDPVRKGPALVGVDYGMQVTPIPVDSVLWTDASAAKSVAVLGLSARRTLTDSVQVTARFVNCSDQRITLRARVSFMDTNQSPSEQPSIWKPVFLAPRSMGLFTENSIGRAMVAHYLIEVSSDL